MRCIVAAATLMLTGCSSGGGARPWAEAPSVVVNSRAAEAASAALASPATEALAAAEAPPVADAPPCPAPFETLASGSCFFAPKGNLPGLPVAIYLHGMTTNAPWALSEGQRLAEASGGAFAVLAPLGRQGDCDWSEEVVGHHCWPSYPKQEAKLAVLVQRLRVDLAEVRGRLPDHPPPVLVGFSNGGYAATLLASRTDLFAVGGLVVLNAGTSSPLEETATLRTLLRAARDDPWHHTTMVTLRERLERFGWSPMWEERDGPHALDASDFASVARFMGGAGPVTAGAE